MGLEGSAQMEDRGNAAPRMAVDRLERGLQSSGVGNFVVPEKELNEWTRHPQRRRREAVGPPAGIPFREAHEVLELFTCNLVGEVDEEGVAVQGDDLPHII